LAAAAAIAARRGPAPSVPKVDPKKFYFRTDGPYRGGRSKPPDQGEKAKAPGDGAGDEFVELTFGHHRRRRFTDWILANGTLADRVFADRP